MSNILDTSFEEKSVWVQLGSVLAALGGYFWVAGQMLAAGVDAMPAYTAVFGAATAFLVILMIAGHVLAALLGHPEDADERDRMIDWRSEANSSWILGLGVLLSLNALAFSVPVVWVANGLLFALFLSTLTKYAWQIYFYRCGM